MPQLDNAVRSVSLAQKHIDSIKKGLRESLKDKQAFTEEMRTNLQAEASRIRHRIAKITYEDKVTTEFYNEKRIKWTHDLDEVIIKLEALHNTEKKFYEEGVKIIETLKMPTGFIKGNLILKREKCLIIYFRTLP